MRTPIPRGVTLIELTVALAIVAILVLIAVPAYRGHLLEAGRSTGAACLLDAEYRIEQHYARTGIAATSLSAAGVSSRCGDGPHYRLRLDDASNCRAGTSPGVYALRAEGEGRQADDGDLLLCVAPSIVDANQRLERLHSRPGAPASLLPGWRFESGQ